MSVLLWRIVIAVIVVVLLFALLPPLFVVLGFSPSAALIQVLRICIAQGLPSSTSSKGRRFQPNYKSASAVK